MDLQALLLAQQFVVPQRALALDATGHLPARLLLLALRTFLAPLTHIPLLIRSASPHEKILSLIT
jgi:hypothetical protein